MANITQNRRSNKKYISNRTSLISLMMVNCSCKNQFPISKASLTLLLDTQFLSDVSISLSKIVNFILINRYHGVLSLTNAFIVGTTPRANSCPYKCQNLLSCTSFIKWISNFKWTRWTFVSINRSQWVILRKNVFWNAFTLGTNISHKKAVFILKTVSLK